MSDRKYSVKEIDELREACEMRWLYGTTNIGNFGGISRQYQAGEKDKATEELVRTHMLAGHTAQELYEADRK